MTMIQFLKKKNSLNFTVLLLLLSMAYSQTNVYLLSKTGVSDCLGKYSIDSTYIVNARPVWVNAIKGRFIFWNSDARYAISSTLNLNNFVTQSAVTNTYFGFQHTATNANVDISSTLWLEYRLSLTSPFFPPNIMFAR
jgi:hypothetical protein